MSSRPSSKYSMRTTTFVQLPLISRMQTNAKQLQKTILKAKPYSILRSAADNFDDLKEKPFHNWTHRIAS